MDFQRLLAAAETPKGELLPMDYPEMVWSTLITGLIVVFAILGILVFILWLMGKVLGKKTPKKQETVPAPTPAQPIVREPEAIVQEETDDDEIIAVITAAVAAFGAADGKQYRIASVKKREKSPRNSWGTAGISENTRPY